MTRLTKKLQHIESIKNISELTEHYSFEDLQKLYQQNQELEIINHQDFLKELEGDYQKHIIKQLWLQKEKISKNNMLLLKALTGIERNKVLEQAQKITNELTKIIENIN